MHKSPTDAPNRLVLSIDTLLRCATDDDELLRLPVAVTDVTVHSSMRSVVLLILDIIIVLF